MNKYFISVMILFSFLFTGCSSTVERVEIEEQIDLSGRWNDSDSRLVSEAMISDSLKQRWLRNYKMDSAGKLPVVIVGAVKNRSHEHINVQTFVKDLERALINSGEVDFVASSSERGEIRDEREEQAIHASEETAKAAGEEIGADFMLIGSINTIEDRKGGKALMFYQTNLELIDIRTNRKVWVGEKKIKKVVKKSRFGF